MKKPDIYGIVGSAVFCGIVLLLLLLIFLPGMQKEEDEGIMVSFGDSFTGGGSTPAPTAQLPTPTPPPAPAPTPTPPTPSPAAAPEEVMTQEDNSLAIAQQREREQREREQAQQRERERQEREAREAEQRRLEEERRQEEQRIAEQRRREQEAIDRANALGSMFGANESDQGSGAGSGNSQQGNPAGSGSSGGNSWSLNGRSLIGSLVRPTYTQNVEGVVTVSIRVDENGNVTSASMTNPSTISDSRTIEAALEAARKTKFSAGRNPVVGTITYNFRLN